MRTLESLLRIQAVTKETQILKRSERCGGTRQDLATKAGDIAGTEVRARMASTFCLQGLSSQRLKLKIIMTAFPWHIVQLLDAKTSGSGRQ